MCAKGFVHVYTGDGKGKTTAAIGLAVRAVGAGKRVLFLQFMKSRPYGEHKVLQSLAPALTLELLGKPFFIAQEGCLTREEIEALGDEVVVFPPGQPPDAYKAAMKQGVERARTAVGSGRYDLVVLDEIVVAAFFGLVDASDIDAILADRLDFVELVFTGRGASEALIARADLVTDMRQVKHYYGEGVPARPGFDC